MINLRIETITDALTNLVYAEIYYPESATEPIAKTAAIYRSPEHAKSEVLALIKLAFNTEH
ncbi:MAG: hypothetical protein HY080_10785 [Gammaproteobacteria bacterium]|nr:hypothetical protein [Gammaproteobacteria bacterium]